MFRAADNCYDPCCRHHHFEIPQDLVNGYGYPQPT
jgi:hypothetical protein